MIGLGTIEVTSALGEGGTSESAFDDALVKCGIHNLNLIGLSSVIPPRVEVKVVESITIPQDRWGDRLYCVCARMDIPKLSYDGVYNEGAVGLGWALYDGQGGVFVKREARKGWMVRSPRSKNVVEKDLEKSLHELSLRRELSIKEQGSLILSSESSKDCRCILVVASYQLLPW